MLRILWNSRTGMMAQQEKLDSIANNIANLNTEGYKKTDVKFRDLVYESLNKLGYPNSEGVLASNGTGVRTEGWVRDESQGNLNQTNINTDLAIDGNGYFSVTTPDGSTAYTRNGSFNVDGSGNIVDKNGDFLNINFNNNATAEDKSFSADNFKVDNDGNVFKKNGETYKQVGKINLYSFTGDDALNPIGQNLYSPKPGVQPLDAKDYSIRQGYLEMSNVDMASEMTDMIMTQRAFELSSKGLKTGDDMWGIANNLRAK